MLLKRTLLLQQTGLQYCNTFKSYWFIEITISTIAYNPTYGFLVIAYTNANIDLIINNKIINISDIKRKNLTGDKNIYGMNFTITSPIYRVVSE
ncbi:MAG: hypothetical protein IPI23_17570 [Bacteroidetes bacterium]|nr:hypothetical protein [Bacteroidota bacterium]